MLLNMLVILRGHGHVGLYHKVMYSKGFIVYIYHPVLFCHLNFTSFDSVFQRVLFMGLHHLS